MEGLADSWRRHLTANEASVTALQVRPLYLPQAKQLVMGFIGGESMARYNSMRRG
jgi:hypothetical protein